MRTGVRQVLTDETHNATRLYQGSPAFLGFRTPAPSQTGPPAEAPLCPAELSAWSRTDDPWSRQPMVSSDYAVWEPSPETLPPGTTAPGQ